MLPAKETPLYQEKGIGFSMFDRNFQDWEPKNSREILMSETTKKNGSVSAS